MKVTIYNSQRSIHVSEEQVKKLVIKLFLHEKIFSDEIIIHFVGKKKISVLHEQFFQDPSPTDCITFPIDPLSEKKEGHHLLGEVFICPKVALEYAIDNQIDPYTELTLYLVHTILHLIGYEDVEKAEISAMRKKEKSCMNFLKRENLILFKTMEDK